MPEQEDIYSILEASRKHAWFRYWWRRSCELPPISPLVLSESSSSASLDVEEHGLATICEEPQESDASSSSGGNSLWDGEL
jgi:hypothetical protein